MRLLASQAGLEATDAIIHVMGRGIERTNISENKSGQEDCLVQSGEYLP